MIKQSALAGRGLGLAWRAARPQVLASAALAIGQSVAPVATVWFTKLVIDSITDGQDVTGPAVGLAGTGLALAVLPQVSTYVHGELERRVALATQLDLTHAKDRFVGLARHESPAFFNRLRLAEMAGRFSSVRLVDGVIGGASALVTTAGYVASLFVLSPLMALLVVLAAVPLLAARLWLGRLEAAATIRLGPAERRQSFYGLLLSSVEAAKEIRLFRLGDWLRDRMIAEFAEINGEKRRVARRELLVEGGLAFAGATIAAGGLIWAAHAARAGSLTAGDVTVFVGALAGAQSSLASAVWEAAQVNEGLIATGHYVAVVDSPPDLPVRDPAAGPPPVVPGEHGIVLDDVWFRYAPDAPWVLRGLTLRIPPGAAVGLVGANGAGKSTIVKLLCRFYDPERGAIRWDGIDLRDLDPAELRARIGAVFQDFMGYDLTAAENIAIGDLAADRERLEHAARRAGVHEALLALRDGYDTPLSRYMFLGDDEHGMSLSGGQWQRLALARALVRENCELMVLDEPSAGLDPQAEHDVHTELVAYRRGRTSVLVSHRLSAVRDADVLVVLADGQVAETGTHDELMALDGRYAQLFTVQASGYLAIPDGRGDPDGAPTGSPAARRMPG